MGLSVGPHAGPTYLVVGDAGGAINPFNGEGIAYAYESGRMAAAAIHQALESGDGMALQSYPTALEESYGLYFKVARAFVRIIGRPELMRLLVSTGMRSRTLMAWVMYIMANVLRPDEIGPAEAAYRAVADHRPPGPGPADSLTAAVGRCARRQAATPEIPGRRPAAIGPSSGPGGLLHGRGRRVGSGLHGALDVRLAVGKGGEHDLVGARSHVHPSLQKAVEQPGIPAGLGGRPRPVVAGHGRRPEEHAHQRPHHRHLGVDPGTAQGVGQAGPEKAGAGAASSR